MSVFAFAISITAPIFVVVLLGFVLRRRGMIDSAFVHTASMLVFRFGLPAILFLGVYDGGNGGGADIRLNVYIVTMTLVLVGLSWGQSRILRLPGKDDRVFVQGVYRNNLAVVGLAFCANAYGDAGLAQAAVPMGILTIVYNLLAVMLLGAPGSGEDERRWWRVIKSILTNPLILALVAGFGYRATGLPLPVVVADAGKYFAAMTLPLALLCIGASLDFSALRGVRLAVATACAWKLIVSPLLFVLGALALGWRGQTLGIIFFFSAAPTAAASFVMVKAVRGNDVLAAAIVVFTTVMSMLSVTLGLYLLKAGDFL
jgi:malonate transporter and related proteins